MAPARRTASASLLLVGVFGAACDSRPAASGLGVAFAGNVSPDLEEHEAAALRSALHGVSFENGRAVLDLSAAGPSEASEEIEAPRHRVLREAVRALLLHPDDAGAHARLAETLLRFGLDAESEAVARTALDRRADDPRLRLGLARALASQEDFAGASAVAREIVRIDPTDGAAWERLALWRLAAGEPVRALTAARNAEALGAPPAHHVLDRLVGQAASCITISGTLPGHVSISDAIRVDGNDGPDHRNARETTVSVSKANPLQVAAGWYDARPPTPASTQESIYFALSSDGGETWDEKQVGLDGAPNYLDPTSAYDDRTGTTWIGGAVDIGLPFVLDVFIQRRDPGGSVGEPVLIGASDVAHGDHCRDKPLLAAGPHPLDASRTRLYSTNVWPELFWSDDMGDKWSDAYDLPPLIVNSQSIQPVVGPEGHLYLLYEEAGATIIQEADCFDPGRGCGDNFVEVFRDDSTSLGSFLTHELPGSSEVANLGSIAVDRASGSVYAVYPIDAGPVGGGSRDLDLVFTSRVAGVWTGACKVTLDSDPPGDQFAPWIDVDEDGRIHMLFYGSEGGQQDGAEPGLFHAYYSFSEDGGQSWIETRLTADAIVSNDLGVGHHKRFGDYNGLATAGGRTYPVYMGWNETTKADIYTHVVMHGPATSFCMGIACPCGHDDPGAGCGNHGTDGERATGARLAAGGTSSAAADDLELTVSGIEPGRMVMLHASTAMRAAPIGRGRLCLGGAILQLGARRADALGVATFSRLAAGVVPGSTWYYQARYSDPAGTCLRRNNTNGLMVQWTN